MNAVIRALGSPVLVLVVLAAALTGCSQRESPGEEVPALAAALDQVDAAIEAENYGKARSAVEFLLTETRRAQQDDDLSSEDADRIRTAARAVLANLPDEQVAPEPQDEPTRQSDDKPSDEKDEKDERDERDERDEEKKEKKDKKEAKDEDGEDGDGSSGGNGPDDGRGD